MLKDGINVWKRVAIIHVPAYTRACVRVCVYTCVYTRVRACNGEKSNERVAFGDAKDARASVPRACVFNRVAWESLQETHPPSTRCIL